MTRASALAAALLLALAGSATACPNCAEAMPGSNTPPAATGAEPGVAATDAPDADAPRQAGLADGFYWSILLMLAVPYTLVGGIGYGIYRATRHRRPAPLPA